MSITHDETAVKSITHDGYTVKTWIHDGIEIFKLATNTAISFIKSSFSGSSGDWLYAANAKIYSNIDTSLYKGVQFYVNRASIGCSFRQRWVYLKVCAFTSGTTIDVNTTTDNNKGAIAIVSAYRDINGEKTDSSVAGNTVTLTFTQSTGNVDLAVVGQGSTTTDNLAWQLSNPILLAR